MKRVLLVSLGLCLMVAGFRWLDWVEQESSDAAAEASEVLPAIQEIISEKQIQKTHLAAELLEMTECEVDGRWYIGTLEIPNLELELPVLSEWSEENAKIAPCRYGGTVGRNNLIICAHNYKSHFGRLKELAVGDAVCFTDIEGSSHEYHIIGMEVLSGTAIVEMEAGDWDLTLFTCTPGGKMRCCVRCRLDL